MMRALWIVASLIAMAFPAMAETFTNSANGQVSPGSVALCRTSAGLYLPCDVTTPLSVTGTSTISGPLPAGTNIIGSVRVLPPSASSFTVAGCSVGVASAQCLAGALAVNSLTIQNTSASVYIACKLAGTAILNDSGSFMLSPLQSRSWNINTGGVPTNALNCTAGSASTPLYVEYN